MIFDRLQYARCYKAIHIRLRIALDALVTGKFNQSPDGRYELMGDKIYALVQTYDTKPRQAGQWEAHRKYTDIQCLVEGSEIMGCAQLANLREVEPLDAARDITFYAGDGNFFQVNPGVFTIFFPHDAHMPSLAITTPARVKKIVMKVACGSFDRV